MRPIPTACLAALLAPVPAPAQDFPSLQRQFRTLDVNQDGWLSGTEMRDPDVSRRDMNADGEVSEAEFIATGAMDDLQPSGETPAGQGTRHQHSAMPPPAGTNAGEDCRPGSTASLEVEGPVMASRTVTIRYSGGPGFQYDAIELHRQRPDGGFENLGGPMVWGERAGETTRELPAPGLYEIRFVLDNLRDKTGFPADGILACRRIQVAESRPDAPSGAQAELPAGTYEPYFTGHGGTLEYWLGGDLRLEPGNRYEFQNEAGRYGWDEASGRVVFTGGPLDGVHAMRKESDGRPAIVIPRKENRAMGIELAVSDPWFYLRP